MKKLRFTHSRIFSFTFIIELWPKIFLSKHKSHNYAAVQMVWWLSSVSTKLCQLHASVRILFGPIIFLFPKIFFFLFFLFFPLQVNARKDYLHVLNNIGCWWTRFKKGKTVHITKCAIGDTTKRNKPNVCQLLQCILSTYNAVSLI